MFSTTAAKQKEIPAIVADFEKMAQAQMLAQKIIGKIIKFKISGNWVNAIILQLDSENITQIEQIQLILRKHLESTQNIVDDSNPVRLLLMGYLDESSVKA